AQAGEYLRYFGVAVACDTLELVGDGQAQHAFGQLMLGIDGENVAADGFGFFGFVEIAVELHFCEGFRDTGFGNGFQLVLHWASWRSKRPARHLPCHYKRNSKRLSRAATLRCTARSGCATLSRRFCARSWLRDRRTGRRRAP